MRVMRAGAESSEEKHTFELLFVAAASSGLYYILSILMMDHSDQQRLGKIHPIDPMKHLSLFTIE